MKAIIWLSTDWQFQYWFCDIIDNEINIVFNKASNTYYVKSPLNNCYIPFWFWSINEKIYSINRQEVISERKKYLDSIIESWNMIDIYQLYCYWYSKDMIENCIEKNKATIEKRKQERIDNENKRIQDKIEYEKKVKQWIENESMDFINAVKEKKEVVVVKDYRVIINLFEIYWIDIPLRTKWFLMNKVKYLNSFWRYGYDSNNSKWSDKLSGLVYDLMKSIIDNNIIWHEEWEHLTGK